MAIELLLEISLSGVRSLNTISSTQLTILISSKLGVFDIVLPAVLVVSETADETELDRCRFLRKKRRHRLGFTDRVVPLSTIVVVVFDFCIFLEAGGGT